MKWSRVLFALPVMAALGAAQARTVTIGAVSPTAATRRCIAVSPCWPGEGTVFAVR